MFDIGDDREGWFEGLPRSQAELICKLLESGRSEEEVAELWLSSAGATTTVGFGSGGTMQNFFGNVRTEFIAFVCGGAQYETERTEAAKLWKEQGKLALVSAVAGTIATAVGLAAVAVVPVVALLFSLVAKMGINAFCKTCAQPAAPNNPAP